MQYPLNQTSFPRQVISRYRRRQPSKGWTLRDEQAPVGHRRRTALNIELYGANFVNKGAELMLRTTLNRLGEGLPDYVPALFMKVDSPQRRAELELRRILAGSSHDWRFSRTSSFLQKIASTAAPSRYKAFLQAHSLMDQREVDALVDLSGFAYSDQWGAGKVERFARLCEYHGRRGRPIVMLPQAFGPFTEPTVRDAFRRVTERANLICARDRESYAHVLEITAHPERLRLSPDITLFSRRAEHLTPNQKPSYCCVVPNGRVLDHGDRTWHTHYTQFLLEASKRILAAGLEVRILVHSDEEEDFELARHLLNSMSNSQLRAVSVETGGALGDLKTVIGQSRGIVGSRYHALVSAFAQGVPSVALGWSHKYSALYADFGMDAYCFDHRASLDEFLDRITDITDDDNAARLAAAISLTLNNMRAANEGMWSAAIDALLRAAPRG